MTKSTTHIRSSALRPPASAPHDSNPLPQSPFQSSILTFYCAPNPLADDRPPPPALGPFTGLVGALSYFGGPHATTLSAGASRTYAGAGACIWVPSAPAFPLLLLTLPLPLLPLLLLLLLPKRSPPADGAPFCTTPPAAALEVTRCENATPPVPGASSGRSRMDGKSFRGRPV